MQKKSKKGQKIDLRFREDEALDMINRYNKAYNEYKKLRRDSEMIHEDDSDSGSSDMGVDKDIMDILNKELQVFEYNKSQTRQKQFQNQYRGPKNNAKSCTGGRNKFKTNMVKSSRLNEMSIFISKDPANSKKNPKAANSYKLDEVFVELIKNEKDLN